MCIVLEWHYKSENEMPIHSFTYLWITNTTYGYRELVDNVQKLHINSQLVLKVPTLVQACVHSRTDIFKTDISKKPMVRYWWQSPLFSPIHSQKNLPKILRLKIYTVAPTGGHGTYMKYVSIPWPPMVIPLPISTSCFLFTRPRKLFFLIYILLLIRYFRKKVPSSNH